MSTNQPISPVVVSTYTLAYVLMRNLETGGETCTFGALPNGVFPDPKADVVTLTNLEVAQEIERRLRPVKP